VHPRSAVTSGLTRRAGPLSPTSRASPSHPPEKPCTALLLYRCGTNGGRLAVRLGERKVAQSDESVWTKEVD